MIDDAIALYHRLLEDDPALARESQRVLDEGLHAEGLFFGDRPLCRVLRPHLITAEQYAQVRGACRLVISATIKLGTAMLRDERLMEPLRLSAGERRLIAVDPGYSAVSAISRLDAFLAEAPNGRLQDASTGEGLRYRIQRRDAGRRGLYRCPGRGLPAPAGGAALPEGGGLRPAHLRRAQESDR